MKAQVALCGCGKWGRNLARNFHDIGALRVVCDASEKIRSEIQSEYGDIDVVCNFEDVIIRKDIKAVIIATPAETHYDLARKALFAGKDVYLEKPMTLCSKEAEDLISIANKYSLILMVGHLLLYSSPIQWIRNYIDSGAIGKVMHISVKRAKTGKVRAHENVMWSFACHDIAAVLYLLKVNTCAKISAIGNCFVQKNIEDDTHLHLSFEDGSTSYIHSSWYWPDNERHYVILGDKKWLKYDEVTKNVTVYNKSINKDLNCIDEGCFTPEIEDYEPLKKECAHFIECIEKRIKPLSCGKNGLDVIRILEIATRNMNKK